MGKKHGIKTPEMASEDLGHGCRHSKSTPAIAQHREDVEKAAARKRNKDVKKFLNRCTIKKNRPCEHKASMPTMNASELESHGKVTSYQITIILSYEMLCKYLF